MTASKSNRNPSWKAKLNDAFVKTLGPEKAPKGYDSSGKLVFAKASGSTVYIVWDESREAPPGFGVKVARKMTYVLRRKVNGKSIMPTVGNCADFKDIKQAREAAAELARTLLATGRNPNEIKREAAASELIMGDAMSRYREHLVKRTQRPATKETLRVFDRAIRKIKGFKWDRLKVREILTKDITAKFMEEKAKGQSAAEQCFRWASRSVAWCIAHEKLAASAEGRKPTIEANPFDVLVTDGHYRTREQMEAEREASGARNPLRPSQDLGPFFEAAWSKKDQNDNKTGIHYLMLMLLWGCRKSEHAACVWGELLQENGPAGVGKKVTSHVAFDDERWGPYVFFYKTKNGKNHRMPIAPMALELLRHRQNDAAAEVMRRGFESKSRPFVFPARSKFSKTGHYSDASELLDQLRQEIGADKLTLHDLRRSFGAVMTALELPEVIKRRFLNHAHSTVTDSYTQAEWNDLRKAMERIEQAVLSKAPNVYNVLKPVGWPPIPAPPPHVCRPVKPRSGRPKKAA